ncbi:unnamed protein product [Spodoptera exigua]|nr:unnamed protein product [Spodoptera exigua]
MQQYIWRSKIWFPKPAQLEAVASVFTLRRLAGAASSRPPTDERQAAAGSTLAAFTIISSTRCQRSLPLLLISSTDFVLADNRCSAPMFAGMRGVHGQMLSGGSSISSLGGFGLSSPLPALPPERKVYSSPPPTPLPTLPSPASVPTPGPPPTSSSSVHTYYQ